MHKVDFIDFNNILLVESNQLNSPVSVLYYEYYDDIQLVKKNISFYQNKIQCIVGMENIWNSSIKFGHTQQPTLWDSPDNIDVMSFLEDN